MTPKEKAEELYNNMYHELPARMGRHEISKNCAIIAVDAIMDELTVMNYGLQYLNRMAYWNEVKEEIEKL